MSATATPDILAGFAGMDAVEIKVTIRPDQELRAERAMEVDEDTADIRIIYFYDTPQLELFEAGVVLRARLVKGDADDSTIKFRPADRARIDQEWLDLDGFKIEADWVGDRAVCSASLTCPQQRDEIKDVAAGSRPIEKLFSKDQERFLRTFREQPVEFAKLSPMGPIRVLRWKLTHDALPYQLTIEEWRLPDGDDLVEVSIKVSPEEAAAARDAFNKHLTDLKLDPQGAQETKTRTALQYFARVINEGKAPT